MGNRPVVGVQGRVTKGASHFPLNLVPNAIQGGDPHAEGKGKKGKRPVGEFKVVRRGGPGLQHKPFFFLKKGSPGKSGEQAANKQLWTLLSKIKKCEKKKKKKKGGGGSKRGTGREGETLFEGIVPSERKKRKPSEKEQNKQKKKNLGKS